MLFSRADVVAGQLSPPEEEVLLIRDEHSYNLRSTLPLFVLFLVVLETLGQVLISSLSNIHGNMDTLRQVL